MKLSISNIAWENNDDEKVYGMMEKYGFLGLEIAPTKVFGDRPYENCDKVAHWGNELKRRYGLSISSMQSIWYGMNERIFGSFEERRVLIEYTKKAIDFAKVLNCNNLVLGCPKNRNIPENGDSEIAIEFFREIGEYAFLKGTTIAMEPNPIIYGTNYINRTDEAIELIKKVSSRGFRLNLDLGTVIYNEEDLETIKKNFELINHVHISEPWLGSIKKRELHNDVFGFLKNKGYDKYLSIEMKKVENTETLREYFEYINEVYLYE